MMVRLAGVVVVVLGCAGCEVAEAPPLRDARGDTRDASETREDTRVEAEPEDTSAEAEAEDTSPEAEPEDTSAETEAEDTSPEAEAEDTSAETEPEDASPEAEPEDTSAEAEPEDTSPETEPEETMASDAVEADAPACAPTITLAEPVPSPHIPTCSEVSYAGNPPTSGPHYPIWAQWRTFAAPVPRGFYVHNLEHGGVVIAFKCPDGCADELAAIEGMIAALPADPLCSFDISRRVVVTPDPLLPSRFAVVAWGASLVADCFDAAAFAAFIGDHYAAGPEDTCAEGVDVTVPDLGTYCPPE